MTAITKKPAAIYDALMTHAQALDVGLPFDVPEPIEAFVPPASGKYIKLEHLPNAPGWVGLRGKMDQGILLVTVVWPKNEGLVPPLEIAGAIEAHFPAGLPLTSNGFRVKIEAASYVGAPVVEPTEVRLPVTVRWTA